MQMVLVKSQHSHRGVVTVGVLEDVGVHPDLPVTLRTGLQALLDNSSSKETAGATIAASPTSMSVMNDLGWETLWRLMQAVQVIASATDLPADAKAALRVITTSGGYTVPHARKRAKQTRATLTKFPDTFSASGKTKAEIVAAIDAMFDADTEEDNLRVDLKTANTATREADKALDKENKRIHKILQVCFPKGSREWQLVKGIPTDRAGTPAKTPDGDLKLPEK